MLDEELRRHAQVLPGAIDQLVEPQLLLLPIHPRGMQAVLGPGRGGTVLLRGPLEPLALGGELLALAVQVGPVPVGAGDGRLEERQALGQRRGHRGDAGQPGGPGPLGPFALLVGHGGGRRLPAGLLRA